MVMVVTGTVTKTLMVTTKTLLDWQRARGRTHDDARWTSTDGAGNIVVDVDADATMLPLIQPWLLLLLLLLDG